MAEGPLGNISPILERLLAACLDAQANGHPLPEAIDAATLAAERMMGEAEAELAANAFYPNPAHGWTCFHCGETFRTPGGARDHFGSGPLADPACRIKAGEERGLVMALREAEDQLTRYRAEDSDKDRELAGMQAAHLTALRREEEKGYARGLHDERERCLRIITRIKAGLRNGGARNACDAIAGDLNEGRDA